LRKVPFFNNLQDYTIECNWCEVEYCGSFCDLEYRIVSPLRWSFHF